MQLNISCKNIKKKCMKQNTAIGFQDFNLKTKLAILLAGSANFMYKSITATNVTNTVVIIPW